MALSQSCPLHVTKKTTLNVHYLHLYPCNMAIHVIFLQVSFDMTKKIYFKNQFDVIEN